MGREEKESFCVSKPLWPRLRANRTIARSFPCASKTEEKIIKISTTVQVQEKSFLLQGEEINIRFVLRETCARFSALPLQRRKFSILRFSDSSSRDVAPSCTRDSFFRCARSNTVVFSFFFFFFFFFFIFFLNFFFFF